MILCIPSEIVAPHTCPPDSSLDDADETTEYSFIYAEIASEAEVKTFCNISTWRYVFTYDNEQLLEGALLVGTSINGVVCESCLTSWVKDLVGDEPYIRTNDDDSMDFISPHGCVYRIKDAP